jgi:hypothetical protein
MNLDTLAALASTLPQPYKDSAEGLVNRMGAVIEGIGDSDVGWRAMTLRLVQGTSDVSKLPDGAKIGSIIHGEDVFPASSSIIPLRSWDSRQYWSPDQNEAKMLCSSPDAVLGYIGKQCKACEHSVYDEQEKSIDCNKVKVFMCISADLSELFLMNFAKTGFKIGSEWQSLQKKAGVAPYRRMYSLKSSVGKSYKNVAQFEIEVIDDETKRTTPVELLPFITELFNQVGADRKEHVESFHKMIMLRKDNPALTTNSSVDSEVVMVGTNVNQSVTTVSDSESSTEKSTSPLAKKYSI